MTLICTAESSHSTDDAQPLRLATKPDANKGTHMMRRLAWLIVLAAAAPALAGGASHWTHTSEAEFKKGKFHNVVATNLGDLKLSRATKTLLEHDARVSSVYALAEGADGTIYAATGPQGILLQLKGDKVSTFATLEDQNVFSLLIDHNWSTI